MPLDPLDPSHFSLSPEQRAADKFATLDRRVAVAERSSLNEVIRRRQYAELLPEFSTSSTIYVALGGPSLTVTVPAGGFVAVVLQGDARAGSVGAPSVHVGLSVDGAAADDVLSTPSPTYETLISSPGGPIVPATFGGQLIAPLAAGVHTIAARYRTENGAVTAFFRNVHLWAEVI